MGTLKPGATYIYERDGDTVYAREFGADPKTRAEVGYNYDSRTSDGRPLRDHLMDDKLWGEIRRFAATNDTLQSELDRVKILYYLLKEDNDIQHHPV
jgi:hypothetical protein